jgi:hypothetical protein
MPNWSPCPAPSGAKSCPDVHDGCGRRFPACQENAAAEFVRRRAHRPSPHTRCSWFPARSGPVSEHAASQGVACRAQRFARSVRTCSPHSRWQADGEGHQRIAVRLAEVDERGADAPRDRPNYESEGDSESRQRVRVCSWGGRVLMIYSVNSACVLGNLGFVHGLKRPCPDDTARVTGSSVATH